MGLVAELGHKLLTVGAQANTQQQTAAGQVVQSGDFLGHDKRIAEGDDQQSGGDLQGGGALGDGGQGDQGGVVPGAWPNCSRT